jgi:type II restriction/modification system DNA methylase subunit YeeA
LTQCLFRFFAEDVGLLPAHVFERLVGVSIGPEPMRTQLGKLFETMRDGGLFGVDGVPWFNGGLFQTIDVPPLSADDVTALKAASAMNWSAIDPSIFGTLFERGLDPAKRSQLGAHYTDPATIQRLVEPVVQRPLLAEWAERKQRIEKILGKSKKYGDKAWRDAQAEFVRFLEGLRAYRVLDPACGRGNFLYLALKCLKDIEHQVNLEAEALGLTRQHDMTGPHNVLGIELNEYAAELARVTVWIGELQWRIQRGYAFKTHPVLEPLDHIECRDAVLNADGTEAQWPKADAAVANPPFVGDKKMRSELGDAYTEALRAAYKGRVPGAADLACYWFEKARGQIEGGSLQRASLVGTNSIRQGANREVLQYMLATTRNFDAWPDELWVNEGAAVRVSLVAFGAGDPVSRVNGEIVGRIFSDLKAAHEGDGLDLTTARPLAENEGAPFFGYCLAGPSVVEAEQARQWLILPNPNGLSNAVVLAPIGNGADVTRRPGDRWVVDFGADMSEPDASLFEVPFGYVAANVRPLRASNNRASRARWWWRHGETRPGLRRAGAALSRWIVTSETAKHRYFVWRPRGVAPEHKLVVIPRAYDVMFGLLSSRMHGLWAISTGGRLGVGNDPVYTTSKCFEPYSFPFGLTPADTAHQRTEALPDGALIPADLAQPVRPHAVAIARAAKRLVDLRDAWLNPPEWTERVPEVIPLGMTTSPYPDRIVAKPGFEKDLARRTLTNLYNQRPAWLAQAHEALDAAVAAAYGWADYTPAMPDDEILRRLLALNLQRAVKG